MKMIYKAKERIGALTVVLLFATLLISPVIGQNRSAGKETARKSGLADIPTLVSLSNSAKVGETVRFVGSQFKANETITISVQSEDIETGYRAQIEADTIYADMKGNFVFEVTIPDHGRFVVSAKGSISNANASRIIHSDSLTPAPIFVSGNPNCEVLNANNGQFPSITSDYGFKLDFSSPNGTFPIVNSDSPATELLGGAPAEPGNSVTVSTVGRDVSWSSTRPISAVIIKGGPNANVYVYDPDALGDNGTLTTPNNGGFGVSHVTFCFKPVAKIIVVKQASPPSSFQFDFTTTGLPGGGSFSLTDDDINSNPMEMFITTAGNKTITESLPAPYTLVSIDCVSQNGTSTINSEAVPTADVDLASGDVVTCTFFNDFLTAVEATVSGRVTDENGRAIAGAWVTAVDGSGNSRSARTNMFGFYSVNELEAGTSLSLQVSHKGYRFPTRFVELNEGELTVNFEGSQR